MNTTKNTTETYYYLVPSSAKGTLTQSNVEWMVQQSKGNVEQFRLAYMKRFKHNPELAMYTEEEIKQLSEEARKQVEDRLIRIN